jgi:hypothetical protein
MKIQRSDHTDAGGRVGCRVNIGPHKTPVLHAGDCISTTLVHLLYILTEHVAFSALTPCNCSSDKAMSFIHVTVHRNRFLFIWPTRRTNYPNLFCHKNLHFSSIFSAHHQEFSLYCTFGTGKFHAGFWWPLPSTVRMELHETYQCRMHSRKLLMMGREDARNM